MLTCCDISWISKFPDEHEVLVSFHSESWTRLKLREISTYLVTHESGNEIHEQFFDLESARYANYER